ncbi:glyoxalase [Dictyobacter vulcani]|uniref:Glyoxalase n=1 Tax=Dictyobacter vulcani TaxID=2607529 RepID=A0A5J4KTK2_9CHLR|nr:VOC family protein [Dictyobacter vulcani]GER91225.1 glyoxalase [Dictyobacter vulcani]
MQLNHLNLCVDDLAQARAFFQDRFDFQFLEQKGNAIAVMTDRHHFTLVLSQYRDIEKEPPAYPKDFHVGFILETCAQVDQTYSRLEATEIQLTQGPRNMRGSYGFYFKALNNILFEVSCPH